MDIGIDLGTTYCVLAVPGQVTLKESYGIDGEYLDIFDVTIIPSPDGSRTFPSVLWLDPDDPENYEAGEEAKVRAESGESVIMFAKRSIGTDNALQASGHTLSATEAAAKMLKYLKTCAEEALGEPVDRAVVTHPAYFSPNQIEETRKACEMAGLVMEHDDQLLMEPTAAALAYLHGVDEDPITVLTYDLGGGTFDVTVLERDQGVISVKGFDGNDLLGGYNFDKALIRWIVDQAKEKGHQVEFKEDDPEDQARYSRLLTIAEGLKWRLAEQVTDKAKLTVRILDAVVDVDGKKVPINEKLSRLEYAELIDDDLQRTIQASERALEKAKRTKDDLNSILLVGGSTYGPWVVAALQAAFPDTEVNDAAEPDLCVAAGAAIQIGEISVLAKSDALRLTLDNPTSSALDYLDVSGQVQNADRSALGAEQAAELTVTLSGLAGEVGQQSLDENGQFVFAGVELLDEGANGFAVVVSDANNETVLAHEFTINYDVNADIKTGLKVAPKSVFIKTGRGLVPIASEGDQLPVLHSEVTTRTDDGESMAVTVIVDNLPVGEITVNNIPDTAGRGATVTLDLELNKDNRLVGTAEVSTAEGSVVAQSAVDVQFPPVVLPDIGTLRVRFRDLSDILEDLAENSPDPMLRATLMGPGRKLAAKIDSLITGPMPDVQEIQQHLRELEQMVNQDQQDMDPPIKAFEQLHAEATEKLNASQLPNKAALQSSLEMIRNKANEAFAAKNQKEWSLANRNLEQLMLRLSDDRDPPEPDLPPTAELKRVFDQKLQQLQADLQTEEARLVNHPNFESRIQPKAMRIAQELGTMLNAVRGISEDLEPQEGLSKLRSATLGMQDIENERIPKLPVDVD